MAITTTIAPEGMDVWGKKRAHFVDFHAASADTYPSGGVVINAKDVGLSYITGVQVVGGSVALGTRFIVVTLGTATPFGLPTSAAIRVFSALGTEVSSTFGADQNVRLLFIGG